MTKKFRISRKLYQKFLSDRAILCHQDPGLLREFQFHMLYLIGTDSTNVAVEAILLKPARGGCAASKAVTAVTMTKAYLQLLKKNLVPVAIGRISSFKMGSVGWDHNKLPVLHIGYRNIGMMYEHHRRNDSLAPIEIVPYHKTQYNHNHVKEAQNNVTNHSKTR